MFEQHSVVRDLANRNKMIVTESLALKPNIAAIRTKLGGVARIFGEWVAGKVVPLPTMGLVVYANTLRGVERARYADVSSTSISIPRGLRVNMPQYVAELIPMVEFCERLERDLLKPFGMWVALRKAAPESLQSSTNIKDLKNLRVTDVTPFRETINELLDPVSRVDRLPMGKLYPNLSSLEDSWRAANTLITRYLATKPRTIVASVEAIAKDIVQIVDELERSGDAEKIAPNTVATLSTICYQMASAVEFYGIVGVMLKELSVVCNNNNVELKKVLKASIESKMVTESLVSKCEPGFELYGNWFGEADLRKMAEERRENRFLVDLEDVSWVLEKIERGHHLEEGKSYNFREDALICVEVDGTLYPIMNLGFLEAAIASGEQKIPVITLDPRHV